MPETQDLFRVWQSCPAFGRTQNHTAMSYTKRRVEFTDARLMGTLRRFHDGGSEPAVGVTITRLIANTRFEREHGEQLALLGQPLVHVATFGLHSLARYFQKAFQPSEARLIEAMWNVFGASQVIQPGVQKFSIPLRDGDGHWYGMLHTAQGHGEHGEPGRMDDPYVSIDVRTYHGDRDHRAISLEAARLEELPDAGRRDGRASQPA